MRRNHQVWKCALYVHAQRARSTHGVHHAIVEVNIVIGVLVVHCELLVVVRVHVPLVVVCDEAVVRRTLGLIALVVIVVFVVAIFQRIFPYGIFTVYTPVGDSELLLAVTEFGTVILQQIYSENHAPNNWPNHCPSGFPDLSLLGPSSR